MPFVAYFVAWALALVWDAMRPAVSDLAAVIGVVVVIATAFMAGRSVVLRRVRAEFNTALECWNYRSEVADNVTCVLLNMGANLIGNDWAERANARLDATTPDEVDDERA